ncbi:Lactonase, 7-bladed beta-propeller-domain-containing protein [Lyophyllum atratum]|nr:Lactonase, 7-bladed beta-propeller-domain-containing protein [Lyophyllum atratum]
MFVIQDNFATDIISVPNTYHRTLWYRPNLTRQESAHPHQVVLHPEREELLVPDLGSDKVWRFVKDLQGVWKPMGHVHFTPGSGPRHVALYRDLLYTVCELSNTVCAHALPALPEESTLLATAPTMEHPLPLPNDMLASEILIPPPNVTFPTPYLYVSNRNDLSSKGDTIAIFDITEPKELRLVAEVRTGLKHVRAMEFGGLDDCWLIVGGMNEGGVKIFERVQGGRGLKLVAEKQDVKTPTGFLWL